MNRWVIALLVAIVTAVMVALAGPEISTERNMVVAIGLIFLAWAAFWSATRSLAARS